MSTVWINLLYERPSCNVISGSIYCVCTGEIRSSINIGLLGLFEISYSSQFSNGTCVKELSRSFEQFVSLSSGLNEGDKG